MTQLTRMHAARWCGCWPRSTRIGRHMTDPGCDSWMRRNPP
jgi:hypothetical protein